MLLFVLLFSIGLSAFVFAVMNANDGVEKDLEDEEQRKYLQEWQEEKERRKRHGTDKL